MSKKKLAGIIAGCIIAIIVVVIVATPLRLQLFGSPTLEESLRERATEWIDLLSSLRTLDLTEEQAIGKIEEFLEPSAARTTKAEEFYTTWAEESLWNEVACSVDDVSIDDTKVHGTVRITGVYEWTGPDTMELQTGDTITATQLINWKLVDKVWYRTMEAADIEL